MRAKLRTETVEPKLAKSSTDSENTEPRRDKPTKDTHDPMRAKLRTDSVDPSWVKHRMLHLEDRRALLRRDSDAPRCR